MVADQDAMDSINLAAAFQKACCPVHLAAPADSMRSARFAFALGSLRFALCSCNAASPVVCSPVSGALLHPTCAAGQVRQRRRSARSHRLASSAILAGLRGSGGDDEGGVQRWWVGAVRARATVRNDWDSAPGAACMSHATLQSAAVHSTTVPLDHCTPPPCHRSLQCAVVRKRVLGGVQDAHDRAPSQPRPANSAGGGARSRTHLNL